MTARRPALRALLLAPALFLAACGQSSDKQGADNSDAMAPAPRQEPATASATPPEDTGLAAYVGKYPFDKVNGVAWSDHPAVKAGLAATVTDPRIRETIATRAGPSAPIERHEGKVMAWACEAHNCGPHQWAVLIDPATGATDACYYDEAVDSGRAHWFLAAGKEEWRDGNCQFGQEES